MHAPVATCKEARAGVLANRVSAWSPLHITPTIKAAPPQASFKARRMRLGDALGILQLCAAFQQVTGSTRYEHQQRWVSRAEQL